MSVLIKKEKEKLLSRFSHSKFAPPAPDFLIGLKFFCQVLSKSLKCQQIRQKKLNDASSAPSPVRIFPVFLPFAFLEILRGCKKLNLVYFSICLYTITRFIHCIAFTSYIWLLIPSATKKCMVKCKVFKNILLPIWGRAKMTICIVLESTVCERRAECM